MSHPRQRQYDRDANKKQRRKFPFRKYLSIAAATITTIWCGLQIIQTENSSGLGDRKIQDDPLVIELERLKKEVKAKDALIQSLLLGNNVGQGGSRERGDGDDVKRGHSTHDNTPQPESLEDRAQTAKGKDDEFSNGLKATEPPPEVAHAQIGVGTTLGRDLDSGRDGADEVAALAHGEKDERHITNQDGCDYFGPIPGYLPGCSRDCEMHPTLEEALSVCARDPSCSGVVRSGMSSRFELRAGRGVITSTDEFSYVKDRCDAPVFDPIPAGNAETSAAIVYTHGVDRNLPDFYDPSGDGFMVDLDETGRFVDGLPSIYLKIASYRDELCHLTLADAFQKANHPERLFVGVVEQNTVGDVPCLTVDGVEETDACVEHPSHVLCRYGAQIRLYKQRAEEATGPTFARHMGDRLYRGEYFVLQTDAHMTFVKGWDDDIILQFDAAKNDYAVLTTYPSEAEGALDQYGHSRHRTTPVMCATAFVGDGLMRHGSALEVYPMFGASPILQPYWAAGFSFSRGHFVTRVPYDCCTPMLFQGEEIDIAVRAWTKGYDMYTPHNSVAFHPYNRKKKPPMFWENSNSHKGEGSASARRVRALIHLAPPDMQGSLKYDDTEAERYGIGSVREVDKFFSIFGINRKARKVTKDMCAWATSGKMHLQLTRFMSLNKKGIDYTRAIPALGL